MFMTVNFSLATGFTHFKYLCVTLHPSSRICAITCFMVPPTDFFRDITEIFPWDARSNTPYLAGIATYTYFIIKMDSSLINQGELAAQVT